MLINDSLASQDAADSDAESIDSEQENALKHAGVYTAEEVALMFRDKLIRLQSLYLDQFKRLHHRLKENRRQYLRSMRSAIRSLPADSQDAESHATMLKIRALSRYYKKFGKEALLVRQCKERRMAFSEGSTYKAPIFPTCVYKSADENCNERALPSSHYCPLHILADSRQVLYTSCSYGSLCSQPVLVLSDEPPPRCHLHRHLQPVKYRYCRREIEMNMKEEHVDVVTVSDVKTADNTSTGNFS
jgi:KAT8 regulatory NSL complex subunit 2